MANRFERYFILAKTHKIKSENYLSKAVKALMKSKGFSKNQVDCFDACFAGDDEAVITFNDEGENADLLIQHAIGMDKEEIIDWLEPELSDDSLYLLKQ